MKYKFRMKIVLTLATGKTIERFFSGPTMATCYSQLGKLLSFLETIEVEVTKMTKEWL